jgi:HSP20 family protein
VFVAENFGHARILGADVLRVKVQILRSSGGLKIKMANVAKFHLRYRHLELCLRREQKCRLVACMGNLGIQIHTIMAVTKVSSTIHFAARTSTLGGSSEPTTGRWAPNTDVYATEGGLVVKVELAGMKSDSLDIVVEGSRLRISGVRQDSCRSMQSSFLVMEITYGPFETVLDLPSDYDLSQAKAVYLNGFLRIDVPPAHQPQTKTKKVHITEGE